MLVKMVAGEEAKRAPLPTALPPSPTLDALRSPSPSFPPPCQAIFKRRCLTNLGRRKLALVIHGCAAAGLAVATPMSANATTKASGGAIFVICCWFWHVIAASSISICAMVRDSLSTFRSLTTSNYGVCGLGCCGGGAGQNGSVWAIVGWTSCGTYPVSGSCRCIPRAVPTVELPWAVFRLLPRHGHERRDGGHRLGPTGRWRCVGRRTPTSPRDGSTCPCVTAGAAMASSGGREDMHVGWPWRIVLHGGSHDLSLSPCFWMGATFREIAKLRRRNKNCSFGYP
jgi:hypothetical protein